jgi:hypothetical protein
MRVPRVTHYWIATAVLFLALLAAAYLAAKSREAFTDAGADFQARMTALAQQRDVAITGKAADVVDSPDDIYGYVANYTSPL